MQKKTCLRFLIRHGPTRSPTCDVCIASPTLISPQSITIDCDLYSAISCTVHHHCTTDESFYWREFYCMCLYTLLFACLFICLKVADLVSVRDINVTRAETRVFACNRRSFPGGVWHIVSQITASHGCKLLTLRSVLQVNCFYLSMHNH